MRSPNHRRRRLVLGHELSRPGWKRPPDDRASPGAGTGRVVRCTSSRRPIALVRGSLDGSSTVLGSEHRRPDRRRDDRAAYASSASGGRCLGSCCGGGQSALMRAVDGRHRAVLGSNEHGQVGDGGMENRLTGTQVPGLSNVVAIASSASATHTCAIRDDGTVWCWGQNQFGQIGDGTDVTRRMATRVPDLRAGSVAANVANTCAATDAGAVVCWGDNTSGQLGTGTTTFSWSPVAASAP
jgi:hypothetical protein